MRVLLPTGTIAEKIVRKAAAGFDANVIVTGVIASFLTPEKLLAIARGGDYDVVITSGMCTASFALVEEELGIPVYRGPRHAADLGMMLRMLGRMEFSRTVPADEFLTRMREEEARNHLKEMEEGASCAITVRGCCIGGTSRMKVLAEIMDAHRVPDIRATTERYLAAGADIIDLGFGFDATVEDVKRVFAALRSLPVPLAADTQDPSLIHAALPDADIILSLQEENIPLVGAAVAAAGVAAVVVPGGVSLAENIRAAEAAGISRIIADPLLQPVGSGLVSSLLSFEDVGYPLFFGAGNVTELIDADSVGVNALLAAMAHECHAAVLFTSEHSEKTQGSVREMRRAAEMMALMGDRPYPKDLGLSLFCIKEKRRRHEPAIPREVTRDVSYVPKELVFDPCGNLRIGIEGGWIIAEHNGTAFRGKKWDEVFSAILSDGRVSLMDHAGYLGKELYKAELALRFGRSFEQDGDF
ncbi:dihydropteroate synthase-like protein [Methanogenium marinum]|uniref:Dihydropteroate synthase-like protein n=1 Tax=Methanogenium marinum TaxID=348610 RepID=A0A9Q4KU63_9EURY|nr:dihydropteroate synthase-like protein [Methanogenium marinum]MDE4908714.1 dihydropteroate synthase-like protein [Methanogenium marinum]